MHHFGGGCEFMRLTGDYHTHTNFSHGKSTVEENVLKAIELGLEKIVISDHGSGHYLYGVKRSRWVEMKNIINDLREKYPQLEILMGVEANITGMDGSIDIKEEEYEFYDVINAGFHYGIIPNTMKDFYYLYVVNFAAKILPFMKSYAREANTNALIKAMEKHPIFMITHPGAKVPINIEEIAQKAAELNIILEINASHGHLTKEDLLIAKKYNVKFAINSDAHIVDNIGNVSRAMESIKYADIPWERIVNLKED